MLLHIFAFLCWASGVLGIAVLGIIEVEDDYYSHLALSLGLIIMGIIFLQIRASQYFGGAATVIAIILSFVTFVGMIDQIQDYVLYREYVRGNVLVLGILTILAIVLFLTGHRMHKMKLVISARLEKNQEDVH